MGTALTGVMRAFEIAAEPARFGRPSLPTVPEAHDEHELCSWEDATSAKTSRRSGKWGERQGDETGTEARDEEARSSCSTLGAPSLKALGALVGGGGGGGAGSGPVGGSTTTCGAAAGGGLRVMEGESPAPAAPAAPVALPPPPWVSLLV